MYFDTSFNSFQTVVKNIYHSFMEVAMKLHRAVKALGSSKQPSESFLIKVISDLLDLAFIMLNSGGKSNCAVARAQVRWSVQTHSPLSAFLFSSSIACPKYE